MCISSSHALRATNRVERIYLLLRGQQTPQPQEHWTSMNRKFHQVQPPNPPQTMKWYLWKIRERWWQTLQMMQPQHPEQREWCPVVKNQHVYSKCVENVKEKYLWYIQIITNTFHGWQKIIVANYGEQYEEISGSRYVENNSTVQSFIICKCKCVWSLSDSN